MTVIDRLRDTLHVADKDRDQLIFWRGEHDHVYCIQRARIA